MGSFSWIQKLAGLGGMTFCTLRAVAYRFETELVRGRWTGRVVRFPAPYDAGKEVYRGDIVAAWRHIHEKCGNVFPAPGGFAIDPAAPVARIRQDNPAPNGVQEEESTW